MDASQKRPDAENDNEFKTYFRTDLAAVASEVLYSIK